MVSLDDIPKKTQYIILDSSFVHGTNSEFALDLALESNTHVEDMGRVLGIKMVDFYITQVGSNDASGVTISRNMLTSSVQKYRKSRSSWTSATGRCSLGYLWSATSRGVAVSFYAISSGKVFTDKPIGLTPYRLKS